MSKDKSYITPVVIEKESNGERSYDIYSRLLKDRIIWIAGEVNDDMATSVIAQIQFLASQGGEHIKLYINSPGGSVTAGLAILDAMKTCKCTIVGIGMGMMASMASVLLACSDVRLATENSTFMIHQVLSGYQGQSTDIDIHANFSRRLKERLQKMLSDSTRGAVDEELIRKECNRDNFIDARDAVRMGYIDAIIEPVEKNQLSQEELALYGLPANFYERPENTPITIERSKNHILKSYTVDGETIMIKHLKEDE